MKLKHIFFMVFVSSLTFGPMFMAKSMAPEQSFYLKNNTCHKMALKIRSNDGTKTLAFVTIDSGETKQFPAWPKAYYGGEGLRVRFYFWPQIAPNDKKFSVTVAKTTDPDHVLVAFTPYEPSMIVKYFLNPDPEKNTIAIEYNNKGTLIQKRIAPEGNTIYNNFP